MTPDEEKRLVELVANIKVAFEDTRDSVAKAIASARELQEANVELRETVVVMQIALERCSEHFAWCAKELPSQRGPDEALLDAIDDAIEKAKRAP